MRGAASEKEWKHAEALVAEYFEVTQGVREPLQFRRFEATPFLLAAWWPGGGENVLVYDGQVRQPRGIADLPAYLSFLGEARIRALDLNHLNHLLQVFQALEPADPTAGIPWSSSPNYKELYPAIVRTTASVQYVVHRQEPFPQPPPGLGAPPPLPPPGLHLRPPLGGSPPTPTGPLVFQRWVLRLHPVAPELGWKLEGHVERPRPLDG